MKSNSSIVITLIIIVLLSGCATEKAVQEEKITIGALSILTGPGAAGGIASKNGIDLAIQDINAQGGIHGKLVRVDHQDTRGDPKTAINAYNHLTKTQGIDFIIGTTWTPAGLALMDIAHQDKVVMVSPSLGAAAFNQHSKYLFNTHMNDAILSEKLADLVYEDGHRHVAIFSAQQPWVVEQSEAFEKRFEEIGGTVAFTLEPLLEATDLHNDALKIKKDTTLDAVILTNAIVQTGPRSAKQMREIRIDLQFYAVPVDQDVIDASEGSYEGMQFLTSLTPSEAFAKRYQETFGKKVDISGDAAYDAVMLLAQAMRETKSTDTDVIADYLNNLQRYEGVSGTLITDGKGSFTKNYILKEIRNGEAITI